MPLSPCVIVPIEDPSIQKTWEKLGTNQQEGLGGMIMYSLVRHLLNKPQTYLSLPNTPHTVQQKEFSTAEFIIACSGKMFFQFGKNISSACEPNA